MQKIYAHRGASGDAPENTLEAFALAVKQGAHGVELDVHLSRDGEIIVAHDEKIDRVSDGTGYIRDMTVAELKGYNFNRTHPEQPGTLPTLREVYELLAPTGLEVNVELKNNAFDYPGLEEKCIRLAAEMGMAKRVLYSSFNHHSLLRVKAIDKTIPCGLLYSARMVRPWAYAVALGVDAIHPHYSELQEEDEVTGSHAAGIMVNPWTVDDEAHIELVLRKGADIVITNYPAVARAIMARIS